MKITYNPAADEMILQIKEVHGKPQKKLGHYNLWWDKEGNYCAVAISSYSEEMKKFKENLNAVHLGGIWKSIKISESDIQKARDELLSSLEEKW